MMGLTIYTWHGDKGPGLASIENCDEQVSMPSAVIPVDPQVLAILKLEMDPRASIVQVSIEDGPTYTAARVA